MNNRCLHCGNVRESTPVESRTVTHPQAAYKQFAGIAKKKSEHFAILMLSTRNEPIGHAKVVSVGSLNVAAIQPRDIFGPCLRANAAAVILAHNHPSGDPSPSPEDIAITRHLMEAGRLLGIEVLDHLVIGAGRFVSLREKGEI